MRSSPTVIRVLPVVLETFRRSETESPLVVAALQLMISAQRKMTISYLKAKIDICDTVPGYVKAFVVDFPIV